ncbi:MAG: DNA-3-methyladenine glycosylase I [Vicinamibacterales bacterium]
MDQVTTTRCGWAGTDPLYVEYHDTEWGVAVHDERRLFEMLTLEGAQAGLSWITILRKREHYRKAFHQFEPERVARFDTNDVNRLMTDAGLVRNRLKIESTVSNARALLALRDRGVTFDQYVWNLAGGGVARHERHGMTDVPARTSVSDAMSRQLKRDGFRFVGSTICYAFMQAVGMVNDHLVTCFRWRDLRDDGRSVDRDRLQ